jgi:hypothetical protein
MPVSIWSSTIAATVGGMCSIVLRTTAATVPSKWSFFDLRPSPFPLPPDLKTACAYVLRAISSAAPGSSVANWPPAGTSGRAFFAFSPGRRIRHQ